ncbi:unnamed protein product [Rotaria magnacalcarata]|uniref:Uncharacterized protein n=1 Tax=Rotaria magnacalcarata TaxID=392030 RepID=A0A819XHC9_9BILA|nr:unnamed protein product [Rotaria magnacalcarata]
MSGQKSKSTVPKSTVSAATSRTKTSDATQPRRRMVQNYLVIWVDGNIDEKIEDCRNTLTQLRAAVNEVNVCTTPEGCIEFLDKMDEGKAFVISSGALGQRLVNDIHGMPKVDVIYIFCGNKARHEPWTKDWPKIRGVFTSIKPICESLKKVAHECDHDSIPMSFVPKRTTTEGATGSDQKNLDQLPPSYIRHLQLQQLHQEQLVNFWKPFTVYRGQGISKEDFQNLLDSKGGLLSFNNFLSTSMEPKVGMEFIERAMKKNQDIVGVIFIMTIDQMLFEERKKYYLQCSVFRVVEMKQTAKNNRLWEVQLTITDDNDPQLSTLTNRIKEEVQGSNGAHIYHQLGYLKGQQGKYQEVANFYEKSLEIKRKILLEDDASLAPTYSNISHVYDNMGEYSKALEFYEKALKILEISLPPNHPNLATSYNNIGSVYDSMGEYSKALSYLEKALSIFRKSIPSVHPNIKVVMNAIDRVKKKL